MLPIILAIKNEAERNFVAELYETHSKSMFLTANKILNHEQDSWDCVHDTIAELIEHFEIFVTLSEAHQINYLHLCCYYNAIDCYRAKKKQNKYEFSSNSPEYEKEMDIPDSSSPLHIEFTAKETLGRVMRVVEDMGEHYKHILYFKYIYRYSDEQGAARLGITVNHYRVRVSRIKKKLYEAFGKEW